MPVTNDAKCTESSNRVLEGNLHGVCIVVVQGVFTFGEMSSFVGKLVDQRVSEGYRLFVLDLREVRYLDSWAVNLIMGAYARLKMRVGKLVLAGPSPNVKQVFRLTGFDKVIEAYNTTEEAVSSLLGLPRESVPQIEYFERACFERKKPTVGTDSKGSEQETTEMGATPATRPSYMTLFVATMVGLLIFGSTLGGLVWVATRIPSFLLLSLLLAVAIIFNINVIVFVLLFCGLISEGKATQMLTTSLGKVPGLRIWVPRLLLEAKYREE